MNFEIIKDLGNGTSSHGFLVKNSEGQNRVVKICVKKDFKSWVHECEIEELVTAKLLKNFNRTYDIPESKLLTDEDGKMYMDSSQMLGQQLDSKILHDFPVDEQNIIAKQLAQFMFDLHSLKVDDFPVKKKKIFNTNMESSFCREDYDVAVSKIFAYLPQDTKEKMNKIFVEFDKDKNIRKNYVLCHKDLGQGNFLYDVNSKKLGIFDFGDVEEDDVYFEFGKLMKYNNLGDDFAVKVIHEYNRLQKNSGGKIQIDILSAKLYGIVDSFQKLKKLEKFDDKERQNRVVKFDEFLNEYEKNKKKGLYESSKSSQEFISIVENLNIRDK